MRRPRILLIMLSLVALSATSGALIATADVPADACDSVYTGQNVNALKAYTDCRFDRVESRLDTLAPTAKPTTSPSATAHPTTTPPTTATPKPPAPSTTGSAATRILGTPRSGLPWHSGAWVGGRFNAQSVDGFGTWRGHPADVVTTYGYRESYAKLTDNSWPITTWAGFRGRLNYSLPMLPDNGEGSLASIGAGAQDAVWRKVAQNLKDHGRGDAIVRVGWESNLKDWRWQATTANAGQWKAAFRRIVTTMRAQSPALRFEFGVNCGSSLSGSSNRLAPLTTVYPGDDVVDIVGCDNYDWWTTHAANDGQWAKASAPAYGPGLADVVAFARAHGKGAGFGEWGLARPRNGNGAGGDNPYFINAMYDFFAANRDVVTYECYFDEPEDYLQSSVWGRGQNPRAAQAYASRW